ncbi:hypothetical protein [Deinococcus hopiensis]|nr:hypothetical protein [Deinococcus hopiensis]
MSDQSYDYVEQAFPEYVDFYGSDGTPEIAPEQPDEAAERER